MKRLIGYLLENMMVDFQGDLSLESVREFLKEDDGHEARQLLQKLVEERGVNEMMITLADCLQEHIRTGINEEVVREQLRLYTES